MILTALQRTRSRTGSLSSISITSSVGSGIVFVALGLGISRAISCYQLQHR
jgi:hypothetical protein